jgi:hypothetical protein
MSLYVAVVEASCSTSSVYCLILLSVYCGRALSYVPIAAVVARR